MRISASCLERRRLKVLNARSVCPKRRMSQFQRMRCKRRRFRRGVTFAEIM